MKSNVSPTKPRHAEEEGGPTAIKNRINAIDVSHPAPLIVFTARKQTSYQDA
jgi:hypothetical protein